MSNLGPIYVYPAYDGATDTTTWHGYVLTPEVRISTTQPTREAVVDQLTRVIRWDTPDGGPVQVVERPWRKGPLQPSRGGGHA